MADVYKRQADGSDTITHIERLQFSDQGVALDLDGNAGQVARALGAVFGKAAVGNKPLVGIGLQLLDGGMSYADFIALAVSTSAFEQLAGDRSNTAFVNTLYRNVVGVAPDAASRDYFVALLESGALTQASFARLASDTAANAQQIGLAGLTNTGLGYVWLEG